MSEPAPTAHAGSRRRHVAANLAGRAWGVLAVYLFLPFYLRFLGVESYGVVGFYAVLLGVMAIADLGLTVTLNRELARLAAAGAEPARIRDTVRTIELPYLAASLLLGIGVVLAAPWIAQRWLGVRHLSPDVLESAVRLMGVALALQLPTSLYQGGLQGLERQVLANVAQIAWGVLRGVGSVLVLWVVAPTLAAYFWWNLGVNALYLLAVRAILWQSLPPAPLTPRFDLAVLRGLWRYAGGMAFMALLSALLIQMDKLVVSRLLPLESFGYYAVAWSLSSGALILASPVAGSLFPRFTALATTGRTGALRRAYHLGCQLVAVLALPLGLTLAVFAREVLLIWTGSAAVANGAWVAATLLTVGSMALALQVVPYNLALAHGWVRLNVGLVAISLVVAVPLLVVLVGRLGLPGGGWAWLIVNLGGTIPFVVLLHRRLLPGETWLWLWADVLRPLLAAGVCVALARLLHPAAASRWLGLAWLGGTVVTAMAAAVLVSPGVVRYLRSGPALVEEP
jgi:O-antigen/teichoic acid export membrane protein